MISRRTNPKPHPVVAHDNAQIADAVSFTTTFFLGAGAYDKHPSMTLERAREIAAQMDASPEYVKTGRKAMIYAVMPEGHTVLVPDDYTPGEIPHLSAMATTLVNAPLAGSLLPPGNDDGLNMPTALKREAKAPVAKAVPAKKAKGRRPSIEFKQARKPTIKDAVTAAIDAGLSPKQFRKVVEGLADELATKAAPTLPPGYAVTVKADPDAAARALAVFVGIKHPTQRHLDALASAEAGKLPEAPDFSAPTHRAYRGKLEAVLGLVMAKDVAALKAMQLPAYDSSAVMLMRYRNLAVVALTAQREPV